MRESAESIAVLHVDDDVDMCELVNSFLTRELDAASVEWTTTIEEAVELLGQSEFDCIVSDYDMPEMDGIEFLELVREDYADLPFILYTSKGSEDVASDAISAGVTEYLQKSGGSEQYSLLAKKIQNAVEKHRAEEQRRIRERRFQAVFEDPLSVNAIIDTDGIILEINQSAIDRVGLDEEEAVGMPFYGDPWWESKDEGMVKGWVERASKGEAVEFRAEHTTPDGESWTVLATLRPVRDQSGQVVSLIASGKDITADAPRMIPTAPANNQQ